MSSHRAEQRRAKRRADRTVAVIPGVMRDRSDRSKAAAMAQAHEELPPVPHSRVALAMYEPAAAFAMIRRLSTRHGGNPEEAIAALTLKLATIGGTQPTVVFASRIPHDADHHQTQHERDRHDH